LLANYITVVEDRPIMSAKYCLPVPVFHFWPKLTTLQRGLSAIAELLVGSAQCQQMALHIRVFTLFETQQVLNELQLNNMLIL